MSMTGIHHVVIRVHHLEDAIRHWRDNLGFTLSRTDSNAQLGVQQAFFELADGGFIELVAPLSDQSPLARALAKNGEGVHLISMNVGDSSSELSRLKAQGIEIIGDASGPNFVHPKSANGVMLGLSQIESH